jgi:hypothetical protein
MRRACASQHETRHERLEPFIRRPIATSLLGIAVMIGGALGYWGCRSRRCRRSISRPCR